VQLCLRRVIVDKSGGAFKLPDNTRARSSESAALRREGPDLR
jgi:hypothetical protein